MAILEAEKPSVKALRPGLHQEPVNHTYLTGCGKDQVRTLGKGVSTVRRASENADSQVQRAKLNSQLIWSFITLMGKSI